jgi:hypothetical protein
MECGVYSNNAMSSRSSGNIVEESFFDKYFAEKLKVPTII